MSLRKPTQMRRRTVLQNPGRIIVHPEKGAAVSAVRHVTIMLPASPVVHLAIGPYHELPGDIDGVDDAGSLPDDIAQGRVYQWPQADPDHDLCLDIRADQHISAFSTDGLAFVSVIIEYKD